MSNKITVPEDGLKAAHKYLWQKWGYENTIGGMETRPLGHPEWENVDGAIGAFLLWFKRELIHLRNSNKTPWQAGYNVALEDVSKMFLSLETEELQDGTVEYLNGTTRPVAIWWEGSRWPISTLSAHETEVPNFIKDLIPKEGTQVGPLYYGITPEEIERTKKIAVEAFKRGRGLGNQK